jgi:hypothetical protein
MLAYSYLAPPDEDEFKEEYLKPCEIPPPKVNGGRDTGHAASGPWGSIPVIPEPISLSRNLESANPPPYAQKQPATFNRPGNNQVATPYHQIYKPEYNLQCIT